MKRIYTICLLFVCLMQLNCKNPLAGIKLYVKTDYFKYSVTLNVQDAANPNLHLDGAIVSISGPAGNAVYAKDGTKKFTITNGLVDLSVIPTAEPTATNPVLFTVNISKAGYIPVQKIVTISNNQNSQRFNIRMINTSSPPGNTDVTNRTIVMNSGGLSKPGYSGARTTGYSDSLLDIYDISLYIPAGTQFYYYQNKVTGQLAGTRASMLTHDSTLVYGSIPAVYRANTSYYKEEYAMIPQSDYTQVSFTGSSVSVYMVYQNDVAPPFSVFTYGTGGAGSVNSILSLSSSTPIPEDHAVFTTAATKRLVGIYFVGQLSNGQYVTVSPTIKTSPTDTNWFLSFKIDPSAVNPVTSSPFAAGDSIETGVDYNTGTTSGGTSSFPLFSPFFTFAPASLNTLKSAVRLTSNGNLRVECQSTDVGDYALGISTPFSFTLNTLNDTTANGSIPDPENLYANATLSFSAGSSSYLYNLVITPTDRTVASNIVDFSGTVVTPITAGVTPTMTGSNYTVYYWDTSIGSYSLTQGATENVFQHRDFSCPGVLFDNVMRFNITLICNDVAGTPKIISPDFNGTINYTYNGVTKPVNCNVRAGYWKTRGLNVGNTISPVQGSACGTPFTFPDAAVTGAPTTLTDFNYFTSSSHAVCVCYFP